MLGTTERLYKYTLLIVLLASIIVPPYIIYKLDLMNTYYVFDSILLFLFLGASVQGIIGLVGWCLLCRYNKKGRKLLFSVYITTAAPYGVYSLYLLFTLIFRESFIIFPLEVYSIFSLFAASVAVIVLQHFWSRYF